MNPWVGFLTFFLLALAQSGGGIWLWLRQRRRNQSLVPFQPLLQGCLGTLGRGIVIGAVAVLGGLLLFATDVFFALVAARLWNLWVFGR